MPLYEWQCETCASTFEMLLPVRGASRAERCPQCGRKARRIMSAGVLGAGRARPDFGLETTPDARRDRSKDDFAIPPMARFCGMDDKAARRLAAYKSGRGHEYDDRQAALQEYRKREGIGPSAKPKKKARLHAEQ